MIDIFVVVDPYESGEDAVIAVCDDEAVAERICQEAAHWEIVELYLNDEAPGLVDEDEEE